jgi:hypothetical protein
VKATHPIQHYHVERCRCRALLAEPTHMKASWLWPTSGGGGLPVYGASAVTRRVAACDGSATGRSAQCSPGAR